MNIVGAGQALELVQAEPFASPVNVGEGLNEVRAFIERFVILTKEASIAVTLWIALSYIADIIEIAPRLAIVSPEPECGKSTLLGILAALCPRVISASNITPSAIFRVIDAAGCATLLMDEIDTFASGKNAKSEGAEAMRGILNSGHSRTTAKVVRTEKIGNSMEARQFGTFAMVAHASIGERIPLTWRSRSVMVRMRRKLRGERTERLTRMRAKQMRADAAVLASKLARMVRDNLLALRDGIPILPEGLPDRAVDNWESQLMIAQLAGGAWPREAEAAAYALSGGRGVEDHSITLLRDVRELLGQPPYSKDATIGSTELCEKLGSLEGSPWATFSRGRPVTTTRLALMLVAFEIHPKKSAQRNEYVCSQFEDVFSRYLADFEVQPSNPPLIQRAVGGNDDFNPPCDGDLNGANYPTESEQNGGLEGQNGGMTGSGDFLDGPIDHEEVE